MEVSGSGSRPGGSTGEGDAGECQEPRAAGRGSQALSGRKSSSVHFMGEGKKSIRQLGPPQRPEMLVLPWLPPSAPGEVGG